jgi:uncharacterized protein (TIGR03067 family)
MKHTILVLFLIGGMAAAADDAASKKLLKDLEGEYKVTAAQKAGAAPPPTFLEELEKVSIKDGKLTIRFKGKGGTFEEKSATITIDASRQPAHIDLKPDEGPKKNEIVMGIVSLEGDSVKLCWGDSPNAKRPSDFTSSKENMNFLLTLKRKK